MLYPPPYPTAPARAAPIAGHGCAPAAGESGPRARLHLPGSLFWQAWSPFRFAAAHLLIGLAPLADLLGLRDWAQVDLAAWAASVEPSIHHHPPPQEGGPPA